MRRDEAGDFHIIRGSVSDRLAVKRFDDGWRHIDPGRDSSRRHDSLIDDAQLSFYDDCRIQACKEIVAPASTASGLNTSFMIDPLRNRIVTGAGAACAFQRFGQRTMNERNRDRSFTDGRRYALDVAAPSVADGEHTRTRGFEEVRRPRERPLRLREIFSCQVGSSLDEPIHVERDAAI